MRFIESIPRWAIYLKPGSLVKDSNFLIKTIEKIEYIKESNCLLFRSLDLICMKFGIIKIKDIVLTFDTGEKVSYKECFMVFNFDQY